LYDEIGLFGSRGLADVVHYLIDQDQDGAVGCQNCAIGLDLAF
jgi:hypothetical protein